MMRRAAPAMAILLGLFAALHPPRGLEAQLRRGTVDPPQTERVAALGEELVEAQRAHLRRVLVWGGANLLLGVGLVAAGREDHPTRHGFGIQTAAWGAINLGIVAWAHSRGFEAATSPGEVLAAENGWSDILLLNLGLNVGYVMVGTALHIASARGLRSGDTVRGHADAVIVQGIGLLVLDGLAWASSRGRLERLHDLAFDGLSIAASPFDPAAIEIGMRIPFGG